MRKKSNLQLATARVSVQKMAKINQDTDTSGSECIEASSPAIQKPLNSFLRSLRAANLRQE